MVDSTKGVGPSQGLVGNRTQQPANNRGKADSSSAKQREVAVERRQDQVEISKEALNLQQAEAAATRVSNVLKEYSTANLGLDPDFDSKKA